MLTEFTQDIKPVMYNFPKRNPIAAAIADVTIVVETFRKGESTITVAITSSYGREIFGAPDNNTDGKIPAKFTYLPKIMLNYVYRY